MHDPTLAALFGRAQVTSIGTSANMQDASQVPPKIAALPMGSLLKGFVINRDPQNNPVLRTDYGDITVKSEVFLKTGSEVVLRLQQQQSQVMAKIVSVNGTPIDEVAKQQNLVSQQGNADSVTRSAISSGQSNNQLLTQNAALQNNILQATLLKPSTVIQSADTLAAMLKLPQGQTLSLSSGANLQFRVISTDLPANQPAPVTTTATKAPITQNAANPASLQSYQKAMNMDAAIPRATQPSTTPTNTAQQALTTQAPINTTILSTQAPAPNQTAPVNVTNGAAITNQPAAPTANTNVATSGIATPSSNAHQTTTIAPATSTAGTTNPPVTNASDAIKQVVQDNIVASRAASASSKAPLAQTSAISSLSSSQTNQAAINQTQPTINLSTARPGVITATVIGSEPSGETIVRTPIGTIRLATTTPPAINSVFQLELVVTPQMLNKPEIPVTTTTVASNNLSATDIMKHWDSLRDLQLVMNQNPAFSAEMAQRIPNTKSAMVNSTLFFMSALQSGDLRRWLGQANQQMLEEKAPNLLKKLGLEINTIRMAGDTPEQPWTMMSIPLMHEEEIHQWRLYLRHDESSRSAEEAGHRFVIDVDMSVLGPIQLDGLTRYKNNALQFDLIVRSTEPLDKEIKQSIRQIYSDTADLTKYQGDIRFQHAPEHFIRPLDEHERFKHAQDGSIIA